MSTAPRQLGKYELQAFLGKGSVGEVWKAYEPQLHQTVAVKMLHPDLQSDPHFLAHFSSQGQNIVSLQHANIVPTYEVNIARSSQSNEVTAYIAMQYIEGYTLADYIHATSHLGNFPLTAQIVYLFTRLGLALDYLHQHNLIHGDIKPGNILLNKQDTAQFEAGEPMLSDSGLEKLLGEHITIASPLYMSPEQAKGQSANKRSDIYSLGVILYEICTGVQPFRAESAVAVMTQHIGTLPTPPILINPHIPPALSEVILRAMAKDPVTRFGSGSALASAIADACSLQTARPIAHPGENVEEYTPQHGLPILGVSQPLSAPSQTYQAKIHADPKVLFSAPPVTDEAQHTLSLLSTQQEKPASPQALPQPTPIVKETTTQTAIPATPAKSPAPTYAPPPPQPPPLPTSPPPLPLPNPRPRHSHNEVPIYVVIAALVLLLLVIGSVIVASLRFNSKQVANTNPTGAIFFQDDALGYNDQLRIDIQNIAPPPEGQSYFAWLQTTSGQNILLGNLAVQNNAISFLYPGDGKRSNLIAITHSVLIVQSDAGNNRPDAPSGKTLYQGIYKNETLQHLQNILYMTPNFPGHQSVVRGLLNTIKSMNDKAGSIVDTIGHDPSLARRQATRILELVDGTNYARHNGDLPPGVQPLLNTSVGLLSSPQQQGYIDTLASQLDQLKQVTDSHDTQLLQHIQNVENAVQDLHSWIQQIRGYASQLLKAPSLTDTATMNNAQRLQSLASDSYTGRTIPPQQGPQPTLGSAGAYQAYVEAQYMATLNLQKL